MPEISRFYGIVIFINYDEHNPPHFHAAYGEHTAAITIDPVQIRAGHLPRNAWRLLKEWAEQHQLELIEDWELARSGNAPFKIDALE
jgi:hypothetical protein